MEWLPTDKAVVVNVATPPLSARLTAIGDPASFKVTVPPVGTQLLCGYDATVTVNVTGCWNADGLAFDITPVVVVPLITCNVSACEPVLLAESIALALRLYEAAAHVVPEMFAPVPCCETPAGKLPAKAHVTAPVAPL